MRLALAAAFLATSSLAQSAPPSPQPTPRPGQPVATPTPTPAAPSPDELEARRLDKLAQPFLRLCAWHTDLESAKRAAARDGKLVLVHCTRTFQPCGTSIRCERGVLSSPEFAAFAERVVLFVHTSARLDAAEDRLLSEWRGSGWPHHVLLDATGRVLGTHESWREKTVAEFAELVDAAERFLEVERRTESATADACWMRLQQGLAAGALSLAEARLLFSRSGVRTAAEAADAGARITDLEVAAVLAGLDRSDEASRDRAGRAFASMYRAGKRPHARNAARDFWGGLALQCEAQPTADEAVWQEAVQELEARFADEPGYRSFLDERRANFATRSTRAGMPKPVVAPTSEPHRHP